MSVNLKKLRVKPKKFINPTSCAIEMTSLLNCWSSLTIDDSRCANSAKALMLCVQKTNVAVKPKNNINYHLSRLGKQVFGK
ncbi:hypothetical protein BB559_003189 [Furculomyces boomerangus]|uniref:CHCH domain-containing protein n=1 Tax=Furculomyces boomerangus TaxID=61424 RepID=A0A2T9Y995_9FUNG|nr:hypothetical protein BB559_005691 [Furculomyces boomerangus]PVU88884.1 hypothetical protein BB559_005329 [Furculomyces boomerangus]PVU93707.1 hypothetical protein BB559_003189 [Furculomyces boomerangus]